MAKTTTTSGKSPVQVSFMLDKELKDAIGKAAARHGRTQGEQLAQSVKDGVMLQDLIRQISNYLTEEKKTQDGFKVEYKPSEDTCMLYIIRTVEAAIKQGR